MKYYLVNPEVAGGYDEHSVVDRSVHPPIVSRLNYEFDDWLGDAIVESFPVYIVTEQAAREIRKAGLTGAVFDDMETSISDTFKQLNSDSNWLPKFVWLKPEGVAGKDDFGTVQPTTLVLSQRAVNLFARLGFNHAEIEPYVP
ncbi:hypothetical protein [Fimbriimonas ginsengisoli]|uniref:Uncharacterized protein n=1 Tax=Fimbriimonas ginsengisoli Gsoil 348 TaxID=661478 RepID=A0A068NYI8_FIMGI|nr:hypothetical protein [Fimbriimonas ginsengisoli]AIE86994.1 hypothetical protein OP10G_3626 [Fimbriimonas ginsengisoli Gsoil 348]